MYRFIISLEKKGFSNVVVVVVVWTVVFTFGFVVDGEVRKLNSAFFPSKLTEASNSWLFLKSVPLKLIFASEPLVFSALQ